ncbi:MAG: RNA methyltransferase [Leptospira sp.]|nr:RNA methyltransferase [Leptospira sp.]
MIFIDSPTDPRLKHYSLLKSKEESDDTFIADNEKTVLRLLDSEITIQSVFCLPKYYEKHKKLLNHRLTSPNQCLLAEKEIFEKTIGFSVHQGFMAVGLPKWTDVDELGTKQILFDTIADSENIGSMIRTAAAFGINSLVFDHRSASPYLRRSIRVSMGNIFFTKIAKVNDIKEYLLHFQSKGGKVISLSLPKDKQTFGHKLINLNDFQFNDKFVLVVGNESEGIQKPILEIADSILYIPMKNNVDSLNVSHALAVALSRI